MTPRPTDPLARLADIHLPPPPADFPWAWGWFALLGLLLLAALAGALYWRRRYNRNAYRRAALAELGKLAQQSDDSLYAASANQLLRRVALQLDGQRAATARGDAWCELLNSYCKHPVFTTQQFAELETAAYQATSQLTDRDGLHRSVSTWLRTHRRAKGC